MTSSLAEVKKTIKLAWPIILGLIGQHMFGLIDTIMVGRHSTVELAAAAFVNNICNVPLVFMYGFSAAIAVLVSQAVGKGKNDGFGHILRQGMICLIFISICCSLGLLFLNQHLEVFAQTKEVTNASHKYMFLMAISLLPLCFFMSMRQFSEGLGHTLMTTLILILGFLLNTFINWLLIFGNWGFPELGLNGAGLATLISRAAMPIAIALLVCLRPQFQTYTKGFWSKGYSPSVLKSLIKIGTMGGVQFLFEVGIFAMSAIMMGWIGTRILASHQIVINLASITFMIPLGLSIATSIRVGNATGQKDWRLLNKIVWSSVWLAAAIMAAFGIIFFFGRHQIPGLFTTDKEVVVIASEILVLAAFFQVFDGIQSVLIGSLRGTSDVKLPTFIAFISYWILGFSLSYSLGFIFNFMHIGIWLGLALSLVAAAMMLSWRFHRLMQSRINS